jgi:ribosomal protein L37AE/L43A/archaellum component FlaC
MGTEEKYKRKGFLSDLLAKAKGSEGFDTVRLRDEIRKEIQAGDKIFGQFRGLVESFQDIISEEKLRYNAAIKALSATSGLSRQDVIEAIDNQLEEIKMLEKGVMSALPDVRDELRTLESRSKEIKSEIAKLREKIGQLEKEEHEILDGMAARGIEMKTVEEAVRKLFTAMGAEMTGIRRKIEEFAAEKVPSQPIAPPDIVESHKFEEEKGGIEEESEIGWTSEPLEDEGVRRCSMCGGQMDFNIQYGMWMCYACGHEEPATDDTEGASELTSAKELAAAAEQKPAPVASEPSTAPLAAAPSVKRPLSRKKPCPACRKQMDWNEKEKTWRCSSCNYERRVF